MEKVNKLNIGLTGSQENIEPDFEQNVANASPEKLKLVGNMLKEKVTWAGIFTMAFGAYISKTAFNDSEMLQNLMDTGFKNPEDIKDLLLAFKVVAGGVLAIGATEIAMGFDLAKDKE